MSIKSRKLFAILVVSMMILTMLPMTAFAASNNSVTKVPPVSVGTSFKATDAPILKIEEKNIGEFSTAGETFRITLENAKFYQYDDFKTAVKNAGAVNDVNDVNVYSDTLAEITLKEPDLSKKNMYSIPLVTEITADGEATVTIDSRGSAVSSGTYVFANAAAGKTVASISKVVTFARTGDLGVIEIDETRVGALGTNNETQTIKIKLPPRFTWDLGSWTGNEVEFTGGLKAFGENVKLKSEDKERQLVIEFNLKEGNKNRTKQGSVLLKDLKIRADRDAVYGEVVADFDGTNVSSQELVIAKHLDYGIEAEVKEVKELVAGRYDNKTAKLTIKENIPGSMIVGREIVVLLPEWVKVSGDEAGVKNLKVSGFTDENEAKAGLSYASSKNEIYFEIPKGINNTKTSKYEFELELSIEADKTGDIVAEFFGAGMEKQELVIAKAVAPVTAEVAVSDLKIGVQNQPAPDIIITETKKGMIDDYLEAYTWGTITTAGGGTTTGLVKVSGFNLTVSLPKYHDFAGTPTVKVTDGNLEIGKPSTKDNVLTIPIKSSSTRPSTITVSDVKVTLDRTVPEGPFNANIGGTAIVKNSWGDATITTPTLFDKGRVVRFHFADVITPAPGETHATSVFTIGEATFTVVEAGEAVEYSMDVAPYIKEGRTFLPLRYVANALGVDDDSILWDPVTRAVTIFKGDRIAQVTIGSKTMLVNGVTINMDVAPEITDGRTMLPIRWMAQALGASIDWDAEARTVTVTQ